MGEENREIREIPERWVILREIKMNNRGFRENMTFTNGEVPGRVLDIAKAEILKNFPDLAGVFGLDEAVKSIFKKLAEPVNFDHDMSMSADRRWRRGLFRGDK
jgi:hypothetical protein